MAEVPLPNTNPVRVPTPVPPLGTVSCPVTSVARLTLLHVATPAEDNERMNWLVQPLPP